MTNYERLTVVIALKSIKDLDNLCQKGEWFKLSESDIKQIELNFSKD